VINQDNIKRYASIASKLIATHPEACMLACGLNMRKLAILTAIHATSRIQFEAYKKRVEELERKECKRKKHNKKKSDRMKRLRVKKEKKRA